MHEAGGDKESHLTEVEQRIIRAIGDGRVATLENLGGVEAISNEAEQLSRSPLLPEIARIFTSEEFFQSETSGDGHDFVARILIDGLNKVSSPLAFAETLDVLLDSEYALDDLADQINEACLARVAQRRGHPAAAGFAIEGALRIALGGWVPEFDLLGVLVRIREPESHLFSRPALRCLGVAYEHWRDNRFIQAINRIAGLDGVVPENLINEIQFIEHDAALELGHAALLDAFTTSDINEATCHLNIAHRRFILAQKDEDRVDARLMSTAVEILITQLPSDDSIGQSDEVSATLTRLSNNLLSLLQEHQLGYAGLDGWRGARLDAEVAWTGLAQDIATTARALAQQSWYDAARTLADVMSAYQATRCSTVLGKTDIAGLRMLLAPRITRGIGQSAALLAHLQDHVHALETRSRDRNPEDTEEELRVTRQLLESARNQSPITGGGIPKRRSATGFADAENFPILASQVPWSTLAPLAEASPVALSAVESALAERRNYESDRISSLVISEIFSHCQAELLECPDYKSEVKAAFDQILHSLLRFCHSRAQRTESRRGMEYLFQANALESSLADDVDNFLADSDFSHRLHTEVRDIGGGRIDLAIFHDRFTIVCELKREHQDLSPEGQRRHLLQAAAYQGSDVQLGFLLVLDLRKRTGPPPHLRANVHVIALDDEALGGPRYVVMLSVPGNRISPSAVR